MSEAGTRAVNCTGCGAPLDLHGGHRVRSLACGYCGAVLDARDEYRVVKQFRDLERPPMPLALGMTGTLRGVAFTVIGVVQYRDDEGYQWLEYQVFSPTHGYHWLSVNNGHFVFSRRVREMPGIGGQQKSTFKVKDRVFKVYESYRARVVFVEGELTYVASVGDVVHAVEGIAPPFIFSRETTGDEVESQLGEYLDAQEVHAAFGLQAPARRPRGIHGAQPYVPGSALPAFSRIARWFALPLLLVAFGIWLFGGGTERIRTAVKPQDYLRGVQTAAFEVEDANSLMSLELSSDLSNAWTALDITVLKDRTPMARFSKQLSYYHGGSGEDAWSEGSRSDRAYFKLAEPGTYTLAIEGAGGTGDRGNTPQDRPIRIAVNEGVIVSRYFFVLALVAILAALAEPVRRLRFESKRWAEVAEDDD